MLEDNRAAIGFERISTDPNVVKVSVIGVGMRTHAGVAQTMFKTLAEGINIQVISTSEIKVSVLIAAEYRARGALPASAQGMNRAKPPIPAPGS